MSLREKCLGSKFFWSVVSRILTGYGEILRISPYSVQVQENTDQKSSKYGHFSCSVGQKYKSIATPEEFLKTFDEKLFKIHWAILVTEFFFGIVADVKLKTTSANWRERE